MAAGPSRCYYHKAADGDLETPGNRIWSKKCGQRVSGTAAAGERWKLQHNTERDEDKWSVACTPLGVIRRKSSVKTLLIACRCP